MNNYVKTRGALGASHDTGKESGWDGVSSFLQASLLPTQGGYRGGYGGGGYGGGYGGGGYGYDYSKLLLPAAAVVGLFLVLKK